MTTASPSDVQQARAASRPAVILVGNPNVGKSVLFGLLTGRYVTVSNYPGTTVEVSEGAATLDGIAVRVVDTPGTNSLMPHSEDERVTRDILLAAPADAVVVQVADMKNARRALLLTLQLAELGVPLMLTLNMGDEARARGVSVDARALERRLGIEVLETVATRRQGVARLYRSPRLARPATARVAYQQALEEAVAAVEALLEPGRSRRARALMLLGGDPTLAATLDGELRVAVAAIAAAAAERLDCTPAEAIAAARNAAVEALVAACVRVEAPSRSTLLEAFATRATHPFWGVPILALVLLLMYQFVGVFGAGTAVDFLESTVFGAWLAPWAIRLVDLLLPFPHHHAVEAGVVTAAYTADGGGGALAGAARLGHDLLVGEYGIVTMALSYAVAIVLPIVGTFFLAFGVLEDSGYLPRLAIMVDRVFKRMGLNGKAVLPMVLGLGCDTMATLTTRILETRRERIIVILLLTLAVPCSAQLGVILAMLGPVGWWAALSWLGVVALVILTVGWLAARLLGGEEASLILEIPPMRVPRLGNLAVKTLARIEWYLKEAVPLFVIGTLVLFVADRLRLLEVVRDAAAPVVVRFLDLPRPATDAFVIGFLRRDFGAAGLYKLQMDGALDPVQTVVAIVAVTLFVPCIAQYLVTIKELGWKTATAVALVVFPLAIAVAGAVNAALRGLGVGA